MTPTDTSVLRVAGSLLREAGFIHRTGGIFERETSRPGRLGWLGLSAGGSRDPYVVYPQVGIRDVEVTRVLASLLDRPTSPYAATASANLGVALDGQPREWSFDGGEDVTRRVSELVSAVLEEGVPFMERLAVEDSAVEALIREQSMQQEVVLPALWLSRSDFQSATTYVSTVEAGLPPSGQWRDFYLGFAARVREYAPPERDN